MHDKTGIYRITCIATGASYVGSAVKLYHRWYTHKRTLGKGNSPCRRLQHAWKQHGADAFIFEVIEECGREALREREDWWLENSPCELNVMRKSYTRPNNETFAQGQRDAWKKPERRAKARKPGEYAHAPETKAKMRAAKLGKPSVKRADPTRCANGEHAWVDGATECRACANATNSISRLARLGRTEKIGYEGRMTTEVRARISASLKGRVIGPPSAEHRRKLSESQVGKVMSAESRAKMSESQRARFAVEQKPQANSTTGVRGLTYDVSRSRWYVQIKIDGKRVAKRFAERAEAEAFIAASRA